MAVLSDPSRAEVWAGFMRDQLCPAPVEKADMRAAVNATDAWIDGNAAAFNAALPEPFRSEASAQQKLALFLYVAKRRFEVG